MTPQELDDWLRRSLDYLTSTSGPPPWEDAAPENDEPVDDEKEVA